MDARSTRYLHPSPELRERARREQAAIDAAAPTRISLDVPASAAIAFANDASDRHGRALERSLDETHDAEYRAHWTAEAEKWGTIADALDEQLRAAGVSR